MCFSGIGIYEANTGDDGFDLTQGILLSLSAGVFLYCTFMSILARQLRHGEHPAKFLSVFVGFVFMAGMAAIPHDH